jgi:hypothetical protein
VDFVDFGDFAAANNRLSFETTALRHLTHDPELAPKDHRCGWGPIDNSLAPDWSPASAITQPARVDTSASGP